MIDIEKFVTLGEDGQLVFDKKSFKSAYDSDFNKSLDTRIANERDKIREEIENEAKLTAEEKMKAEKEKLEKEKLATKTEINRIKAKAKMESLYTEKEIERLLKLVTDDDSTLADIDEMIAEKQKANEEMEKKFKEEYTKGQPTPKPNEGDGGNSTPKPKQQTAQDIKNFYK